MKSVGSHRLRPGARVRLARIDPRDTGGIDKGEAHDALAAQLERLAALQEVLYAEHRRAVLVVLQGMDTAGKDGTVKHVMTGVNPSACEVVPFKVPTEEELAHDFLWRIHRATPRRGHITIFNRSHYEDVIVPRVHRTLPQKTIRRRYDHINAFERLLVDEETVVLKFFLHIRRREQAKRLRQRRDDPRTRGKFSPGDVAERRLWPRYMAAYGDALSACTTAWAPWHVVPADHKWYRNLVVADVLTGALERLRLRYPRPTLSPRELHRFRKDLS